MKVTVTSRNAAESRSDALVLALGQVDGEVQVSSRTRALDRALGGPLASVLARGDFKGRRGESLLAYPDDGAPVKRVVLVGLGEATDLEARHVREAAGAALRAIEARGGGRIGLVVPGGRRVRAADAARALAEGLVLSSYRFDRYRTGKDDQGGRVQDAVLHVEREADARAARREAATGAELAECQNLARDLSNEPANELNPAALARAAQRVAREVGLEVKVLDPAELRRRKLGAMLAVAQGSANTPRMIVLEHDGTRAGTRGKARGRGKPRPPVCLVGKGVCFDSGGLSLKPSASMVKMKHDMSGAAAVIGAMRGVALQKLPQRVVGIVGAVENMPSGTAYRPDDIVKSGSGKTIEITNTDAEGRLVLADALHYARSEYEPAAIVDLATLTGACIIALGPWAAAVIGNDDALGALIREAGDAVGERYWPLPLWDEHRKHMRSTIADVRQTAGREAGTTTAAAFLAHFAGDQPWAHLDIASMADTATGSALQRPGATGFGVRTLVEMVRRYPASGVGGN
jgi:leucyl aminopeptidase